MAFVIDTSVFITLERRHQSVHILLDLIGDEYVALASITASELLIGMHLAASPQSTLAHEESMNRLLDTFPVLPFDLQVARTHARLWAQLRSVGQMIGAHDLIIAATALAHGYDLLTGNVRDFGRVPDLTIRQPAWN